MPLFLSDEEYGRCAHDVALVVEKADSFIRDILKQLETAKAQSDAASLAVEQSCTALEHKYVTLSDDYSSLQSRTSELKSELEGRSSELEEIQAEKQQLRLQLIAKEGELERLSAEAFEVNKSKKQLLDLIEQKEEAIADKSATIQAYLDKIVNITTDASMKEARLSNIEAELLRNQAGYDRLSQEKELIEHHNSWLNEELNSKLKRVNDLSKSYSELEVELSSKLTEAERQYDECSKSLVFNKERVKELEIKLSNLQEEHHSSKVVSASREEQFQSEISTANKLVDLYKASSEEWSKKATDLEGAIMALETSFNQAKDESKQILDKEVSAKQVLEKEVIELKDKIGKCESELEKSRKSSELPLVISSHVDKFIDLDDKSGMIVNPSFSEGISGTALAASLLRDGWSLAKMYSKYQEAVDAFRHEQDGRRQAESILTRVLNEVEKKAALVIEERAEHEKMVESYSKMSYNLQHALAEQALLEKTIQELEAELRKQQRDYSAAQNDISDLQKQVTVLLKECRDVQLKCGSLSYDEEDPDYAGEVNEGSEGGTVISNRLLTFKDISGLVEQNAQLRNLVRTLSQQIEERDRSLTEQFELEVQTRTEEVSSKIESVLERCGEQTRVIESLHNAVAMYKRLYEEEQAHHGHGHSPSIVSPVGERTKAISRVSENYDDSKEQVKSLHEELEKSRREIASIRIEREKLSLEASFARERLDSVMKEVKYEKEQTNQILRRNVDFSQLVVNYQKELRENGERLRACQELSQKLNMDLSMLKCEKELLSSSEKRACDEVRSLSERAHRLQATLDAIKAAEEAQKEARTADQRRQDEHARHIQREWAEAKKELQEERDKVRILTLERERLSTDAMKQVDDVRKQLSNALHAVTSAEIRASLAESRCADMSGRLKSTQPKCNNVDLDSAAEIERLKCEAEANRGHMLQFKNIAQVNEDALKQMQSAYEKLKLDHNEERKILQSEVSSIRETLSQMEAEIAAKSEETAVAISMKEEAVITCSAELFRLADKNTNMVCRMVASEVEISVLKEAVVVEHQKFLAAQRNYERQVLLQSETIQELTQTSQALSSLQHEATSLRGSLSLLNTEYNDRNSKWETEKSNLHSLREEAEMKYNEVNEQNKILLDRLEAVHTETSAIDTDSGLRIVITYLRRSKEIAETEISLLKQEKLRMQYEVDATRKEAETAQASLLADRAKSKALILSEDDIKSLQLQVREVNLLRESNTQLREENKHNFEECQRSREVARVSNTELESCKTEKEKLKKRINELTMIAQSIDLDEYGNLKDEVQNLRNLMNCKDEEMEKLKEKEEVIEKEKIELSGRVTVLIEAEAAMRSDIEKQQKIVAHLKKSLRKVSSEKDEMSKQVDVLGKQLEDSRQAELAIKEKEKEDEARIHILEVTVEKQREQLKREKNTDSTAKPQITSPEHSADVPQKTNVETRKPGRRLVRPRLATPSEPQNDTEVSESEQPSRKRLPAVTPETHGSSNSAPLSKKSKTSDLADENVEISTQPSEALDSVDVRHEVDGEGNMDVSFEQIAFDGDEGGDLQKPTAEICSRRDDGELVAAGVTDSGGILGNAESADPLEPVPQLENVTVPASPLEEEEPPALAEDGEIITDACIGESTDDVIGILVEADVIGKEPPPAADVTEHEEAHDVIENAPKSTEEVEQVSDVDEATKEAVGGSGDEVEMGKQAGGGSSRINIQERAKARALIRQSQSSTLGRGSGSGESGRTSRFRGPRGRGGRGQA